MGRAKQRLPRRSDTSESAPPFGSLCAHWKSLQGLVCAVLVSISTESFFSSSFPPSSPQRCQLRRDFHDASRSLPHLHCLALIKTLKFPEPIGIGGGKARERIMVLLNVFCFPPSNLQSLLGMQTPRECVFWKSLKKM